MEDHLRLSVRVTSRTVDRSGAVRLELRPKWGVLPRFKAGAHIDMFLPNGLLRSYSLMNDEAERDRYVCGIGLDRNSRGGSAFVHDQVHDGTSLTISAPKNLFPLVEAAERSVLIAGGIGVTPLISMARRLNALGRKWMIYYCARSRAIGPFFEEVEGLGPQIITHFDDEMEGRFFDLPAAIAVAPTGAHFYCCGPSPMINAFEAATAGVPRERVHLERFASDEAPATGGGFTVELVKSGLTLRISEGKTILETLEDAGVDVPFSCLAGICGSCATKVLEGIPDHRDMILTDREKSRNDQMMICCSGSKSDRLVLDR
jgi:ferredoxin-NADP reductase